MQDSWAYTKDSGDFLKKIKNIGKIPEGAILVTADVIGLYPSIFHGAGLEALRKILSERDSPKVPTEDIVRMAEFVLKNNFFEFNGEVKRQKSGTAIGTKFAPPYGCICMDEVEAEFRKSEELQSFLWLRCIDDMFFIRTHGEEMFTQSLNEFNNFHSYLKFTYETSSGTVNFLDLNVSLRNGAIHTHFNIKPTDSHHYLHHHYSHPLQINTSIPCSQALKVNRICSSEKDFKTHVSHMKEWFLARGYSEIVVNNQIDRVISGRDQSVKKNLESGIPFITIYNPKVKELEKLIRDLLPF